MRIDLIHTGKAVPILLGLALILSVSSGISWAQEEVTSSIYRYRERVATGYYEGYEVSPRRQRATIELPATRPELFPFGLSSALVRIRSRLPDAHRGLKFYERNTCIDCHPREARNIHSTRALITCRQCHGPEPIAAVNYWFSPLNPIRRNAYVCGKCHENANFRFAQFYVHEPPAGSLETLKSFPVLFISYWAMLLLLVGTLAFFVPHAFMVGFRELSGTQVFRMSQSLTMRILDLSRRSIVIVSHRLKEGLQKLSQKKKDPKQEAEDAP